ncbi:MAG TPA: hypothetical protein VGF87_10500 [Acidimicrobiales bacterium]
MLGVPATTAAAADSSFVLGTAGASAQVLSVPLALGGDNLGVTDALSNAGYTNINGQSESEVVATGLTGSLPIPEPAQLLPLEASSTSTLTSNSRTLVGSSGEGLGTEAVAASQSSGLATTTFTGLVAGNDIVVSGGQSVASGSLLNGATRQAESSADVSSISLLNGLIVLSGLQWAATQRTGANAAVTSSFSIASVKVAGVSLPVNASNLGTVFASLNTALATTGFHISPPTQLIGANGSVTETPLSIGIDNSALGQKLLGPVVSAVQPLRNVIFNDLARVSTETGTADLALELALGILGGQGDLDLELGGAYATSDGTTYADPFGTSSSTVSGGSAAAAGPNAGSPLAPSTGFGASPLVTGAAATPAGTKAAAGTSSGTPAKNPGPVKLASSTSCVSTTVGACRSDGAAKTIAIVLVAATALLAVAEYLRQRRRLRRDESGVTAGDAA